MFVAMSDDARKTWMERALRTRWLARAPIWLYRARLSVLFGSRMLMLEHTGRRTGLPRHVVLEVVSHPAPGRYLVVSGFGTEAQWFHNVMANPHVRISVSTRHRRPALSRQLEASEAQAVLRRYAQEHLRAWRRLEPIVAASAERSGDGATVPVVEFTFER